MDTDWLAMSPRCRGCNRYACIRLHQRGNKSCWRSSLRSAIPAASRAPASPG